MREIKFRGKNKYDGKFVYGFPHIEYAQDINYQEYPKYYICGHHECVCIMDNYKYRAGDKYRSSYSSEVIPETVGQFTGLLDKNGKEIYEGDIIQVVNVPNKEALKRIKDKRYVVTYDNHTCCFFCKGEHWLDRHIFYNLQEWEQVITGNIHDNPELINKIE